MSFDWKEYIVFAEDCLKRKGEACLRSSISRAYYGIFCIARNQAGFGAYTGHWEVIDNYKTSYDKDKKYIGKILDNLRKERNNADYDEKSKIDERLAERMVAQAKQALTLMGIP